MKNEERKKWSFGQELRKSLLKTQTRKRFWNFSFRCLQKIGSTPVIQVDKKGKIIDLKILNGFKTDKDSIVLYSKLEKFKSENNPIKVIYKNIINQTLYYGDTPLLKN